MKRIIIVAAAVLVAVLLFSVSCAALGTDGNYMYDSNRSYHAPASYTAERVLYGEELQCGALNDPQDLFVAGDRIYIADTGNNRIVITDQAFRTVRVISSVMDAGVQSDLFAPNGVFYGSDGLLYICDTENFRMIAVDDGLNVVRKIIGEDIVAINKSIAFRPRKIAVDGDSTVYIVAPDIYQGILQYDSEDRFMGFFAPNEVKLTLGVRLIAMWKNIFSKEQQDQMEKNLPLPYNNIYYGQDGYLYTTAGNVDAGDEIKRLNALGNNILRTPQTIRGEVAFGDLETSYENGTLISSSFVDVHTDPSGIMCALDSTRGRLFQYDRECNMICVFGGKGTTAGTFRKPVAVERLGDRYLVLDADACNITVFQPTAYLQKVHAALEKYNDGLYGESIDQWREVMSHNANYTIAYRSIGRALLQQGDYRGAMKMLKKGNDSYFYSMALKEYRKVFIRQNLLWLLAVSIGLIVGLILGVKRIRRWLLSGTSGGLRLHRRNG